MLRPRSTRLCVALAIALAATSCDRSTSSDSEPSAPRAEWIDPSEVQPGPTLHESLPDELVTRIESVHATFADVDGTSLDKWLADFQSDLDPEGNVRIWEDMQVAYSKFCEGRDLPLETRKEVYKVVLFRSMAPASDVLERIELVNLTQEDAVEIMNGYPGAPKPIEVIRTAP